MKKIFTIATLLSIAALGAVQTSLAADAKAELRQKFKDNVKTAENGDVVIADLPKVDMSKLKNTEMVGPLIMTFISYVDPDINFEELDKSIVAATGGKKPPVPISAIMAGIGKYLGRKNMQFQSVPFSGNNIVSRIEDGVPVIAWVASSDIYQKTFVPRTEKRAGVSKSEDWAKELRKLEQKKLPRGKTFSRCLILGCNKTTDEFLLAGVSETPVWMTAKEVKAVLLEAYVLRY